MKLMGRAAAQLAEKPLGQILLIGPKGGYVHA
jgi:hypothetical protein